MMVKVTRDTPLHWPWKREAPVMHLTSNAVGQTHRQRVVRGVINGMMHCYHASRLSTFAVVVATVLEPSTAISWHFLAHRPPTHDQAFGFQQVITPRRCVRRSYEPGNTVSAVCIFGRFVPATDVYRLLCRGLIL